MKTDSQAPIPRAPSVYLKVSVTKRREGKDKKGFLTLAASFIQPSTAGLLMTAKLKTPAGEEGKTQQKSTDVNVIARRGSADNK